MTKLKIGEKELKIKFGYEPTLKERVISNFVKIANLKSENPEENMEKVEDLLLYLPEILLVGLQVYHKEYRYDYDTKEGKKEQLQKMFDLMEEYSTQDDANLMGLFNKLQDELTTDGFLSRLFQKEQKAQEAEGAAQKTEAEEAH